MNGERREAGFYGFSRNLVSTAAKNLRYSSALFSLEVFTGSASQYLVQVLTTTCVVVVVAWCFLPRVRCFALSCVPCVRFVCSGRDELIIYVNREERGRSDGARLTATRAGLQRRCLRLRSSRWVPGMCVKPLEPSRWHTEASYLVGGRGATFGTEGPTSVWRVLRRLSWVGNA